MLSIDNRSRLPIHEQLQNSIIQYIALGIYAPNEQLPSVRALASELGVNPNTVQKAYRMLEEKGVVYSIVGKGAFVSDTESTITKIKEIELGKFREMASEAKSTGLTKKELSDVLDEVFEKGGVNND